jgi:putative pre-16S rRNA nuclease
VSNKIFLCFDHGVKRIGVAVGQSITTTATALETLHCKNGKPDWQQIARLIKQWRPAEFIVGLPLTMDGERQAATELAEKFSRQLSARYLLPVHLADERLSSIEAKHRLQDSYNVDPVAAQIILESWLEDQKQKQTDVAMPDQHMQYNDK